MRFVLQGVLFCSLQVVLFFFARGFVSLFFQSGVFLHVVLIFFC